jgi:hypothetical protein
MVPTTDYGWNPADSQPPKQASQRGKCLDSAVQGSVVKRGNVFVECFVFWPKGKRAGFDNHRLAGSNQICGVCCYG